jgi:ATP-binding cassette, subfamily B, bacterial
MDAQTPVEPISEAVTETITEVKPADAQAAAKDNKLMKLLAGYRISLFVVFLFTLTASLITLFLPRIMSSGIEAYIGGASDTSTFVFQYGGAIAAILVFSYFQNVVQVWIAERVGRSLRDRTIDKISRLNFLTVMKFTSARLLTNLTSDIDGIKMFISQGIATMISAAITLVGAAIFLLAIDWRLGLAVLTLIPLIGVVFMVIFSKVGKLFERAQSIIDSLNRVINENVVGAPIVRVLNSQAVEFDKFITVNTEARNVGVQIMRMFAALIPVINLLANGTAIVILVIGGNFVLDTSLKFGDFVSFNSYVGMLIYPIFVIGFTSSMIARAGASLTRIYEVLDAPEEEVIGQVRAEIAGQIELKNVTLSYEEKQVLKELSFEVPAKSRTAIIGPTAAGKTQLMNLISGLLLPTTGEIKIDGRYVSDYDQKFLHDQIGMVFQDSLLFNSTIRENIAFSDSVDDAELVKALATAELADFIKTLPNGLDTLVSERGTTLSGGQKQRIMLARALALNPKVLLLDDFTARVDAVTQKRILENIQQNYPNITIISITQKIASVQDYDQIILVMEGELIAKGTHAELLKKSSEYMQIFNSQQSTNEYELQIK